MAGSTSTQGKAVGIFGGTFDPVHYGHLRAALESRELLGLDDFRLLPAGTPPHRSRPVASAGDRLAMLRLAASGHPEFRVDDREIRRRGYSYMVDTLGEIRGETGNVPILLIVGQDAANGLDSWHDWRKIFDLAHLVIMRRPDSRLSFSADLQEMVQGRQADGADQLKRRESGRVLEISVTQLAISATDIRNRLAMGVSPSFLLPDRVLHYIGQKGLYRG